MLPKNKTKDPFSIVMTRKQRPKEAIKEASQQSKDLELAVFDLDYTIWDPEMYQLHGKPKLVDKASQRLSPKLDNETKTKEDGKILVDSSNGTPIRVFHGA